MNDAQPPAEPTNQSPSEETVEGVRTDETAAEERPNPWSAAGAARWAAPPPPAPPLPQQPAAAPRGWEWSPAYRGGTAPEPALSEPAATPPSPAVTDRRQFTPFERVALELWALALALFGGLFAIIGAFFQELQSGIGILLVVLAAPVIEEALKPGGIYLLLLFWPYALRGRLHTALLCAISGAVFGVVESLIYVEVYYPDGSNAFVLFRFTVTPVMHALASFIVGYGLTREIVDWANGKASLPAFTRNCFLAGIGLHALYNTAAVVLGLLGVLDFLET